MAHTVQMTTEQLQQLIEAVRISAVNAADIAAANTGVAKSKGSFANCAVKFGGQRDYEAVEEFITAMVTYKEIESINDEDALKGISLLFYGAASVWWQGIRKEAKTWNDVLGLIRDHFSPVKPAYQVYMEIFEKRQEDSVAIDTFVCQKRALLAQLPSERHDEETELDLIYGLLNLKYRKHIARHDVKTFKELLEKGRIIEQNSREDESIRYVPCGPLKGAKNTKRCTYCSYRGHTQDQCRKKLDKKSKDQDDDPDKYY